MSYSVRILLVCLPAAFLISANAFNLQPRIFGGNEASPGQFPYIASLRTFRTWPSGTNEYKSFCGGAIISENWIVSAAHCFYEESSYVKNIVAVVGAHELNNDGEIYMMHKMLNHPKFSRDSEVKAFDVALLQTDTPITFNDKVQPIPISKQWISGDFEGSFAGWGLSEVSICI